MAKYMLRDEIAGDGCVLCLPMNECAGSYVYDRSGYGNHGTIHGATWQGSRPRNALKFGGEQTYVGVPDSPSLDITDAITVEAWIYPYSMGYFNTILVKGTASDNFAYFFAIGTHFNNSLSFQLHYVGTISTGTVPITLNSWNHVVAVREGNVMKTYINGQLSYKKTNAGTGPIYSNDLAVDIGKYGTAWHFNGIIGSVRIYNRALSADEVRDHFLGRYTDNSGLRLYLPMNEGAGSTVWDRSPYGNHGTLYNFPDTSAGYGDTHDSGWTRYGRYENGYLYFNGSNAYVEVQSPIELPIGDSSRTIEALIKVNSVGRNQIVWWGSPQTSQACGFRTLDPDEYGYKGFVLYFWSDDLVVEFDYQLGVWYHAVAVYDEDTNKQKIYLNGNLLGQRTPNVPDTTYSDLLIGYRVSPDIFNGLIDSVRIYNRALSAEEIQALYRGARVLAQRNLAVIR